MTALKSLYIELKNAKESYEFHKQRSQYDYEKYFRQRQKKRMYEDEKYIKDLESAISILKSSGKNF